MKNELIGLAVLAEGYPSISIWHDVEADIEHRHPEAKFIKSVELSSRSSFLGQRFTWDQPLDGIIIFLSPVLYRVTYELLEIKKRFPENHKDLLCVPVEVIGWSQENDKRGFSNICIAVTQKNYKFTNWNGRS